MKSLFKKHASVWILIIFCLILSVFLANRNHAFFSLKNLVNILESTSYRTLLAIGMTFIIASGAIDLSIGSVLSLSAILTALCLHQGLPVWLCVIIGLASGGLMGAINGVLIHLTRINALIITLATSYIFRGVALIITLGSPITKMPQAFLKFGSGDIFGMEAGVTMAILALLIAFPIMYQTKWGHYLTGLGGNALALKRAGVRIGFYRIGCFIGMGLLAALAGIIITSRLNSAEPNAGLDMEMYAITAVIMGGTPLSGGKAELAGTAVAVFLLGLIRNGLTILSVSSYYQQFITGTLLLIAVIVAELNERKNRIA
ncbi:MAG: ABC transporter permease [Lachnospiraceae bacterium]|nr:ABC transporter permease [Candidatus Equihabitans merdae]